MENTWGFIMYDYLIVGAGITGSVIAHEMHKLGKKVLVIDSRDHVGGNCFSKDINGVHVNLYGGHFFHTNSKSIYDYVNNICPFTPYYHRVKVNYKDNIYSFPINMLTFFQLWGTITPEQAKAKIESVKLNIVPTNFEEKVLSMVGEEVYYKFFYGYTKKHWGVEPKELSAKLISRIPIRFTYDDRYSSDLYQGMPEQGYDYFFNKLLDGIEVKLDTQYNYETIASKTIYTGSIDQYYKYIYGTLPYRSVYHTYSDEDTGAATINYTSEDIKYTRQITYNYFYPQNRAEKVTATEFASDYGPPYYPIDTEKSKSLYNKYKEIKNDSVIFAGRLGTYAYLDMDKALASALKIVKDEL
jgi:UDP-galactopyranose mutase